MKIRTDFVTNSSSSSFVVEISFTLKDGREFSYCEVGMDGEGDPIVGELYLHASPRQLGMCKTVDDMIKLLKASVKDEDWGDGENVKKLFDENDPDVREILSGERVRKAENEHVRAFREREKAAHEKAQEFIREIETIGDMSEIEEITISGDEQNYEEYDRTYTYNLVTGEYTCQIYGEEFEKDGGSGGGIYFKDSFLAKKRKTSFDDECDDDEEYDEYDDEEEDDDDEGYDGYSRLRLTEDDLPIVVHIGCTGYEGRSERIEHVKVGDKLILKADFESEFDDTVEIEVFNSKNQSLGYLSDTWEHPLSSIVGILDGIVAYVDSVTPLSARRKNAKSALLDVKLTSKKAEEEARRKEIEKQVKAKEDC